MQGYEEIFNQRGKSYQLAMEKYPDARKEEFQKVVNHLKQIPKSVILDLPAGGGYLKDYLNPDVTYLAHDFSGEFNDQHTRIEKCKESRIDLEDGSVDEIVSLAALHHILDRQAFYLEMKRIMKPGGQMIIADASSDGLLEEFLNGFVNQWNSMGHNGKFIIDEDIAQIEDIGFFVRKIDESYQWNFIAEKSALDFFRLLFCLDQNPPDNLLSKALAALGTNTDKGFAVDWKLSYLICEK